MSEIPPCNDASVPLVEYLKIQFEHRDRAVEVARKNIEMRLEAMNKLKEQISTERGLYLTRDRYDASYTGLDARLANLEKFAANIQGRIWAMGAAIVVVNILIQFWKK